MKHHGKKRALIVDSNEHDLHRVRAELEIMGFHTHGTWSGQEALQLLHSKEFQLLLVDDYLPDLHTADFLKRVRRLPLQPQVVVMQKHPPRPTGRRRFQALGARAVVDKNDTPVLRAAVRSCTREDSLVVL